MSKDWPRERRGVLDVCVYAWVERLVCHGRPAQKHYTQSGPLAESFWLGGLPRRHSRLALLCYTFCFCLAGGGLGWKKELEDFARAEESRCEDSSSADGRGRHDYRRQRDPALAAR